MSDIITNWCFSCHSRRPIQGKCAVYIEKITGDYYNVVGLPISRVYQELKKLGMEI